MNEHFDLKYINNIVQLAISNESEPVPMATLKRMFNMATEDGNWFRAITCLSNVVLNKIYVSAEDADDIANQLETTGNRV